MRESGDRGAIRPGVAVGLIAAGVAATLVAQQGLETSQGQHMVSSANNKLADVGVPFFHHKEADTQNNAIVTSPDTATADPSSIESCVQDMSIAEKVGWVTLYGLEGNQTSNRAVQKTLVAAKAKNVLVTSAPQSVQTNGIRSLKQRLGKGTSFVTDEEGGSVQRFRSLIGDIPSATEAAGSMSAADYQTLIQQRATALHKQGIDGVFGPVVDVGPLTGTVTPMADRVYSSDPRTVTEYANAAVSGWQKGGIWSTLKHFPGHGSATADTHISLAKTPNLSKLKKRDLNPYERLASVHPGVAVMVGHLIVPEFGDKPASINPAAYKTLRDIEGLENSVVYTDSIDMEGVLEKTHGSRSEAAIQALNAGADIAVYAPRTPISAEQLKLRIQQISQGVTTAVEKGRLPESRINEAVTHVITSRGADSGICS